MFGYSFAYRLMYLQQLVCLRIISEKDLVELLGEPQNMTMTYADGTCLTVYPCEVQPSDTVETWTYCWHDWKEYPLFTSVEIRCSKCGKLKEDDLEAEEAHKG